MVQRWRGGEKEEEEEGDVRRNLDCGFFSVLLTFLFASFLAFFLRNRGYV